MLKKIVSIFMLCQLLMCQAFAGGQEELRNAFDELSYSLTVEWDQKDSGYSEAAISKFHNEVTKLRASGLSDQDMAEVMKTISGGKADAEIDNFVRRPSVNELQKIAGLAYDQGASYVPAKNIVIGVLGGAALIFVAGLIMWELGDDPKVFGDGGWNG